MKKINPILLSLVVLVGIIPLLGAPLRNLQQILKQAKASKNS
jgi:hypothetical protein